MRAAAPVLLVLAAACGPKLDPLELADQKPFLVVSFDTAVSGAQVTELPEKAFEFALSSTFDFENACVTKGPLRVDARADAAPGLQLGVASWPTKGSNRWSIDCGSTTDPCDRARLIARWDTTEGRWDATLGPVGNGLATASNCSAQVAADALESDQVVVEGTCTNLLTTFTPAGETESKFGPSSLRFRALCPRP